jgi:putative ABC transport system permease protein
VVTPLRRKLLRDIGRHRAQFVAIGLTMFLGVTIFGATYDSFRNLQASYAKTATEFRFANLTVAGGEVKSFAAEAAAIDGVEEVALRVSLDVPLQVGEVKLLGRMIGLPGDAQPGVNRVEVLAGRYFDAARPSGVLVEKHMADHFRLSPGDTIQVLAGGDWLQVTVVGSASSPEYIWPSRDRQELLTTPDNFGVIFAPESFIADLGFAPNETLVYYDGGEESDRLSEELTSAALRWGAAGSYTRAEQASNAALEEDLRGFEEMAVFFPMLFLSAAAMAAYVMISRLVHAQRPQIGVMLANGFTRGQVMRHYLGFGFVPGLAGAIPGALAGVLLARVITGLYTGLLAIPITLIQFYPVTLAGAVAFGLIASGLAALAPALFASRVAPAEAMRGETPTGGGRRSVFERVLPPLRSAPVAWRMALRGVGRNRRRTAYTIIGVVLSLMLVLVSWGMIDTVGHLLDRQFVDIQQEDATVYFATPADTDRVAALTEVPGVDSAEAVLVVPASLAAGDSSYSTSLSILEDDTEMHRFAIGGDFGPLPGGGVVLGRAAGDLLDVAEGDTVSIIVPGIGTLLSEIVAFVDEPLGTVAYMARSDAEASAGVALPVTAAMVAYTPDADRAAMRETLTAIPEVAAFEDANALFAVVQEYMVLFYAFVAVMLVFGAAMAFALIFNAMSVNIAERTREVATLLAVGTDRRSISRYITAENMLVAIMGIPLGLVVGYFAAGEAMASFSSDLFAFDLHIAPMTFVWSALAMLAVALVSQWPGLRAVRRISIAKVVKERSA